MIAETGVYLFKSGICLVIFYSVYWFLMRKETFFVLTRYYLLGAILFSLIVPALTIKYTVEAEMPLPDNTVMVVPQDYNLQIPVEIENYNNNLTSNNERNTINNYIKSGLPVLYGIVLIILILRLLFQLFRFYSAIRKSGIKQTGKYKLIFTDSDHAPFSFFNFIFINIGFIEESDLERIIVHEEIHIRQRHYIDLLLVELLTVFQWFNPVVWLYEKSIKENHEYLADKGVISRGFSKAGYQALIVNQVIGLPVLGLANNFNHSLIKKRLNMMTNNNSSKSAYLKVMLILPVMLMIVYAFAEPDYIYKENIIKENVIESTNSNVAVSQINYVENEYIKDNKNLDNSAINYKNEISSKINELITVSGKVTCAETGEAMPDVSIIWQNTTTGTISDIDGAYKLRISEDALISFSFVGYETRLIPVDGNEKINVILERSTILVGEIEENDTEESTEDTELRDSKPAFSFTDDSKKTLYFINDSEIPATKDEFEEITTEMIESIEVFKNKEIIEKYGNEAKDGVIKINLKEIKSEIKINKTNSVNTKYSDEEVFVVVETMPEYPGGQAALRKFIASNLQYPSEAKQNGISGTVYVKFVVNSKGVVEDVSVDRGVESSLDEEAVRIISNMPKWKYGMQRNKPVSVNFVVPIVFRLDTEVTSDSSETISDKKLTSSEIYDSSEIDIFPNPNKGSFTVSIGSGLQLNAMISVYNSNGKLVTQINDLSSENEINLETEPAGTYLIKIKNGKNEINKTVIIQ